MKRKIIALAASIMVIFCTFNLAMATTWDEYAEDIYKNAKEFTEAIKTDYENGLEISDIDVEFLYRMYHLQRSAKELVYLGKANWTTIVLDGGKDGFAEIDKTLAETWLGYIEGEISKTEFLEIFFILYME